MYIDEKLRELLISPTLNGALSIPVDEFFLETENGPVALAATLQISADGDGFLLDVRDSEGRNLSGFFTTKKKVSPEDALKATGVIGNMLRVEFRKIWPPCSSTIRPIGDVQASSAIFEAEEISITPQTDDTWTYNEIKDRLEKLNPHKAPIETDEIISAKDPRFEHIAIFANTKIQFFNGGVKWEENHLFWGKKGGSKDATWDGVALGGTFSLRQAGKHLEVGFRHDGDDDDEARLKFDALLQAVAYTHAIFPWPTFIQRRRDWKVMEQTLKVVREEQGKMAPLRDRDGFESKNSPTDLIASVANLFEELSESKREELKEVMWVFRGADSRSAPSPLQMAMICSVIEGLRTELFKKIKPPTVFNEVRQEALEWINSLETSATSPERLAMVKRLYGWVDGWPPNDRRVEWNEVFLSLFPGRDEWVVDLFKLFGNHRHGPAHGNYGSTTKGDPHSTIEALGRLAGFVNIIIAAKAGYRGPILESPFGDRRIDLGH